MLFCSIKSGCGRTLSKSTITNSGSLQALRQEIRLEKDEEIDNIDTVNDISDTISIAQITRSAVFFIEVRRKLWIKLFVRLILVAS
ncbi:unnamed protein product [Macrosiphum euphorbiae]|uniref:Uncharacterized protein n=1 Tax=Macrosiphum euphorbiae TaxID=13131 RepID=A0AAV0WY55_9HEMI|nr:unnamed protein product [Macrosiphum euphorbiae]